MSPARRAETWPPFLQPFTVRYYRGHVAHEHVVTAANEAEAVRKVRELVGKDIVVVAVAPGLGLL